MKKVKLTITKSNCRGGYCKQQDVFIVDDLCPPLCHELWNYIYPLVYALKNGADKCVPNNLMPGVPMVDVCVFMEKSLNRNRRQL